MRKSIRNLFELSSNLKAFLKPFQRPNKIARISPGNKVISAYIYDWDNRVSENNALQDADISFAISLDEGDEK